MDAITLLKDDHKTVKSLFRDFERAKKAGSDTRASIVGTIIEELSVHAAIEEGVFYPAVDAEMDDLHDSILESIEEHHLMKWTLQELAELDASDERFDAKTTVLIEVVKHHVEEEEEDWFPKVRQGMSRTRLAELGDELEAAKKDAPRRPLPKSEAA